MNTTLPQLLRAAPASEDEPDAELAPEPAPSPGLPALTQGGQMAWREQAGAAVVHAFRVAWLRARTLSGREGGMVHGLLSARPPSVLEQHEYAKSRAWVPPGHDGGIAEKAGVLYHALIGRPGVAFFDLGAALVSRPLRFFLFLLVAGLITLIACLAL